MEKPLSTALRVLTAGSLIAGGLAHKEGKKSGSEMQNVLGPRSSEVIPPAEDAFLTSRAKETNIHRGNKTAYVAIAGQGLRWREDPDSEWYDDPFPQRSVDLSQKNLAETIGSTKETMITEGRMWTVVPSGEEDTDFDSRTKLIYDPENQQNVDNTLEQVRTKIEENAEIGNVFIYVDSHGGQGGALDDGRLWIGKGGIRFEDFNNYLAGFEGINLMVIIEACYSGADVMPFYEKNDALIDQNPVISAQGYGKERFIFTVVSNSEMAYSSYKDDFSKPTTSEIFFEEMLNGGTYLDIVRRTNNRIVSGETAAIPWTTFTRIGEDNLSSTIFGRVGDYGGVKVEMYFPEKYSSDSLAVKLDIGENGRKIVRNTSEVTSTLAITGEGMVTLSPLAELQVSEAITQVVSIQGGVAIDLNSKTDNCIVGGFENAKKKGDTGTIIFPIANVCNEEKIVEVLHPYNPLDVSSSLDPYSIWLKSTTVRLGPHSIVEIELPLNRSTVVSMDTQGVGFPVIISIEGVAAASGEGILTGPLEGKQFLPYKVYLPVTVK